MPNWWGGWLALLIVVGVAILIPYVIYSSFKYHTDCVSKGGVPSRVGCLKPEVFLK